MKTKSVRRYDLDWLRVIVFGLLIFYHVGMFFVPWGWHIKNNIIYEWLQLPMLFLNQWRLPILFVISGMGTAFAFGKRNTTQFIKERVLRLYIPLVFGMAIIIPPQVYIERIANGDFTGSYLEFWIGPAFQGIYPEGNFSWHHLWFLPYLLVYSIVMAPIFSFIRKNPDSKILTVLKRSIQSKPLLIYLLVIPLFLYESLLEPFFDVTHNLVWDWFNFISSLTLFVYGFLLISIQKVFWSALQKIKKTTLIVGICCFSMQVFIWYNLEDNIVVHFVEAALKTLNIWSWILTIFGFGATWLNQSSQYLAYANRAVYPFYILHQTITVILGYYVYQLDWGFFSKASVLIIGTFGGAFLIYEFLIRRIKILQPVFGVKSISKDY
jgi:glucan biosynthesis protein C